MTPPSEATIRAALGRWAGRARFFPSRFPFTAALAAPEPVLRAELRRTVERRRWLTPSADDPWSVPAPDVDGVSRARAPGPASDVPCPACAGLGRERCGDCRGAGCPACESRGTRACASCAGGGTLRNGREVEVERRSTTSEAWIGAGPRDQPSSVVFEGGVEAFEAWRKAAKLPPFDLPSPEAMPDARVRTSVRVTRSSAWRIAWSFEGKSGHFWIRGEEVVDFPHPPVDRAHAVAWAASTAAALLFAAVAAALFWPKREIPSPPVVPPPPPPVAEAAPLPPPPLPVILELADGRILRGRGRRSGDGWMFEAESGPLFIDGWKIDAVHEDARTPLARQKEKAEALRAESGALSKEARLRRFAALFAAEEAWARWKTVCREEDERRTSDETALLLAACRSGLEAARPEAPPKPEEPEPAPVPVPAPAWADRLAGLGDPSARLPDPDTRAALLALAPEAAPIEDLLLWLALLLSRGEEDWGLTGDWVRVKAPAKGQEFEATLDASSPDFVAARLSSGERMTAIRQPSGRWLVRMPEVAPFEAEECAASRGAPSPSGRELRETFKRFGPAAWAEATPAAHLEEARRLGESHRAVAARDRSAETLIGLAAAHASAVLAKGAPAEVERASALLSSWGILPDDQGAWIRPADAGAARAGYALRFGPAAAALSFLEALDTGRGFATAYRRAATELRLPAIDVGKASEWLDRAEGRAPTERARRHVRALSDALSLYKRCARCGGDAALRCSSCRGRGGTRTNCGRCAGHGVVLVVGSGGGTVKCPSCKFAGDYDFKACSYCGGRGRVDCADCRGKPRAAPKPDELATLQRCPACLGRGAAGRRVATGCPACLGLGFLLQPAAQPDLTLR